MSVKILDCTLRDGGYYNKWDFDQDLVAGYLDAMSKSKIDYVELGLRQFKNQRYLGAHAYTSKEYIDRLNLPKGPTYGLMIDAKTVLEEALTQEECIDSLFRDSSEGVINLVRVAAHFAEVKSCLPMLTRLKEKGYIVGLNIMQASLRRSEELSDLSALIYGWSVVDVLYFADSLGSMFPKDVERVFESIRNGWGGEIGFHAHNNMGQAVLNVNAAVDLGCTWIDGTVTGMGRGAGNAETEYLLEQPKLTPHAYDSQHLFILVTKYFENMKKECGWGPSLAYYIGAVNGIHPTYVQELSTDASFDKSLLPNVLVDLGRIDTPHVFDQDTLAQIKSKIDAIDPIVTGKNVENFLQGKEILLVAQTPQSISYKESIIDYVGAKKPILIAINQPLDDLQLPYNYVAVSHNEKFRTDELKYGQAQYQYIAPKSIFSNANINIAYDYGVYVKAKAFDTCGSYAIIPSRLTLAYAIAFCLEAGAVSINLVGFGGYSSEDDRQKEMQAFLGILSRKACRLESLTPTSFNIVERSIYAI